MLVISFIFFFKQKTAYEILSGLVGSEMCICDRHKTASNMEEVIARGGRVVLLSDKQGIEKYGESAVHALELPSVDPFVAPILYAIPVQLLAYHVAVHKGTDVDQPRNLAKSVTVE